MKRKISSTVALTLLASNINSFSYAIDTTDATIDSTTATLENSLTTTSETTSNNTVDVSTPSDVKVDNIDVVNINNTKTNVEAKGDIEVDINFSLPIKFLEASKTNIQVVLKDDKGSALKTINLGSDNMTGDGYSVRALDSKRNDLTTEGDVEFYHLTFSNLDKGNYSLEISGDGYKTADIENIALDDTSKRVSLGTSDKTYLGSDDTTTSDDIIYNGVFLAGDVDGKDLVTNSDYETLIEKIRSKSIDAKYDLNRDGKVDIVDLTYVHPNIDKKEKEAKIEKTNAILDLSKITVNTTGVTINGDIKNLFVDSTSTTTIESKEVVSETSPIEIPIGFDTPQELEQVSITVPSGENAPSKGVVVVTAADGTTKEVPFDNTATYAARNADEVINVDLGEQVAVAEIKIKVTGTRGNKNLTEIAKVEFLNNVYKEMPKPKMNVPVINKFTSKTQIGKEELFVSWNHEENVTGYEIKLEEVNEEGKVLSKTIYKTADNFLKVAGIKPYAVYRVSIQSLNGKDWQSGYKDEQDGYDKNKVGTTNLETNKNDKDGKPDNVDKNYVNHAWNVTTGNLDKNASSQVNDAYTEELKGANNYGQDSIVELQVVPEGIPEGPHGITLTGEYKAIKVNWKNHSKAKQFDIYYRKADEKGAWIKANDPNKDYVDTNPSNDIPDGAANLTPAQKTDKDELITDKTSYTIEGLEDETTYEVMMTATNHHGTGELSESYLIKTAAIKEPQMPKYKLINTDSDSGLTNHIVNVDTAKSDKTDINNIVDGDFKTAWVLGDWDGGVDYGQRMPIVTFDKDYTFDTINLSTKLDGSGFGMPFQAKVRLYDENGNQIEVLNKNDITLTEKRGENGQRYMQLKLNKPVTARKVEVNLSVYAGNTVSISEMKFYHYDSLENEVKDLFNDPLQLTIKDTVTQGTIDALRLRANTRDEVSREYHPQREDILVAIQRAEDILQDKDLKDELIPIDAKISNHWPGNNLGQSNDWQSLGVAVKPGDKINIYIGKTGGYQNTTFQLGISQHFGESNTAIQTYSQELKVGKNEITIPESAFNMDCEKGGNLYLRFSNRNFQEGDQVKVRVSGGTEIPHLNVNDIILDKSKEQEAKDLIRTYIRELKSYVDDLPNKYPQEDDRVNNIYTYDEETSILNSTEIEGDNIMLSLPATQILKGIEDGLTTEDQMVDRVYETLLAWEQMMEVSFLQQGIIDAPIDFDGDGKITNNALDELGGKSENQYYNENRKGKNRMNIKYQRMFPGAFMYASAHHVGIGFGSTPDVMKGVPFKVENGELVNKDGYLFGWGIGHEIGHVHDRAGLTYPEVTNNILALITQTFDDTTASRLEGGTYTDIYKKVTSQSEGVAKGSVGLGMFWQLHLAYDNENTFDMLELNKDGDISNDTFYAKLYRVTREKGIAPSEQGHDRVAQTFLIRSSDAVGKDLREFFEKWGIVASPKSNEYLDKMKYPKEDKAIYYLNDEARRKRLTALENNDIASLNMSTGVTVTGTFGDGIQNKSYINKKEVPLQFKVDKDNDKIFGYEIIRKQATSDGVEEVPCGFVVRDKNNAITEYTDVIDSLNNRVFEYSVRAYDYNLNVTDTFKVGTVKVNHDGSLAESGFTFDTNTRGVDDVANEESGHGQVQDGSIKKIIDNNPDTVYEASKYTDECGHTAQGDPYITVDLGNSKSVVGLKYTPPKKTTSKFSLKNLFSRNKSTAYNPISKYEVYVSEDGSSWTKAHSGTFDTTRENKIFFNENGSSDNNQLWAYNAKYVKLVAKGAETISVAELDILGPTGDNIEIGLDNNDQNYQNGVGKLASDYTYAPGKVIPKDSIIVMGEYKGDPAFNIPLILNEDNENFALESQSILLAKLPEGSELGAVAEGTYIYWITPEQQNKVIDGEPNIKGTSIKAQLYRYNKLNEEGAPVGQRLVSDSFYVDIDTKNLPTIDLTKTRSLSNLDVVEVDKNLQIRR